MSTGTLMAVEILSLDDDSTDRSGAHPLPPIDPSVRLSPFHERGKDDDRFLVEAGNACFVVSRALHDVIEALRDERPANAGALSEALRRRTGAEVTPKALAHVVANVLPPALFNPDLSRRIRTPFIVRMTLLRKEWTAPVTRRLTWMYAPPVVGSLVAAAALIAALAVPRAMTAVHAALTAREFAILYLAVFLSGLWHELGHATACTHYGCPHEDIGFGLYFIFPAFYSDVTKAWRLPAKARAVVDLGGMYFQSLVVIGAGAYALRSGNVVAFRFLWVTVFMMLHNLNPVFKMDGYWLFSDLSGVANLHKRMGQTFAARLRGRSGSVATPLLVAYLGAVVLYGAYLTNFLVRAVAGLARSYPGRAAEYLRVIGGGAQWKNSLIAAAQLLRISVWPLLLSVVMVSLAIRLVKLFRSAEA